MRINNVKIEVILIIFLFCSFGTMAQINLKVGYDLSYFNPSSLDKIISDYNQDVGFFEEEMKSLSLVSGLTIGLRYKMGRSALEFSFQTGNKNHEAAGVDPFSSDVFRNRLFYGVRSYSLGYQTLFGDFGYGFTFGTRKVSIRTDVPNDDDLRIGIVEESNYSSRFYLMYRLPSQGRLSFTLVPYVEMPWGKTDITALADNLGVAQEDGKYTDGFRSFGISLVFYNGPR